MIDICEELIYYIWIKIEISFVWMRKYWNKRDLDLFVLFCPFLLCLLYIVLKHNCCHLLLKRTDYMTPWQRFSFSRITSTRDGTPKPLTHFECLLLLKVAFPAVTAVRVMYPTTETNLRSPLKKEMAEMSYCSLFSWLIHASPWTSFF